jgi:DMSO reductase anchor subunit
VAVVVRICQLVLLIHLSPFDIWCKLAGCAAGIAASVLATLSCSVGAAIERWLFFAEAKHVVALYYGKRAA